MGEVNTVVRRLSVQGTDRIRGGGSEQGGAKVMTESRDEVEIAITRG